MSATTLTVSWNCTNFWMLMYTDRPHLATVTMVEKLSSRMITSALSFATFKQTLLETVRLCVCECVWAGTTVGLPAH
jgi:hypothetical protein